MLKKSKKEKLSRTNDGIVDSPSLIKELRSQVSDMENQIAMHKRKLIAYREAAKKFKEDLDKAEESKKTFLEDMGLYEEYLSIQSAVKLTTNHKASQKTTEDYNDYSNGVKNPLSHIMDADIEPDTITLEPSFLDDSPSISMTVEVRDHDDLSEIKGIGPKFQVLLNNEGIYTFEQISNWTNDEVEQRDKRLAFRGRVEREKWVDQAKDLILKRG